MPHQGDELPQYPELEQHCPKELPRHVTPIEEPHVPSVLTFRDGVGDDEDDGLV